MKVKAKSGNLPMSDGEIVYLFKNAKSRKFEIRILAELNSCDADTIKAVLERNGIDVDKALNPRKNKPVREAVARRILYDIRCEANMSMGDISNMTDISVTSLFNIENGKRNGSVYNWLLIQKCLNINDEDMWGIIKEGIKERSK